MSVAEAVVLTLGAVLVVAGLWMVLKNATSSVVVHTNGTTTNGMASDIFEIIKELIKNGFGSGSIRDKNVAVGLILILVGVLLVAVVYPIV
ncbi:hypothetical protein [Rhodococcoides navarretei]|uniref:Uncharacterized protein n=1 Tax=Rhodococcus navarretei TaxID=3128981 RepID=A0ABU9CX98_9NOCA